MFIYCFTQYFIFRVNILKIGNTKLLAEYIMGNGGRRRGIKRSGAQLYLVLRNVPQIISQNYSIVTWFAERSWRDLSPSLPLAPGRVQQGKE
jgi:hypothetical protein